MLMTFLWVLVSTHDLALDDQKDFHVLFLFFTSTRKENVHWLPLVASLGPQRLLLKTPCLLAMTFLAEAAISQCTAELLNEVEPMQVYTL